MARITAGASRIDLNRAPRAELLQLPNVGPALAERIEEQRRLRGGFRSVEDLGEVPGIGPATLPRLLPWVCVSPQEPEAVPLPTRRIALTDPAL